MIKGKIMTKLQRWHFLIIIFAFIQSGCSASDMNSPYDTIPSSVPVESSEEYPHDRPDTGEYHTFGNDNIPQIALRYPYSWQVEVKEYYDSDTKGFISEYFNSEPCLDNCMGVRFSKGTVSLELVFVNIFDDNVPDRCSNTVDFWDIGNGWYRLQDSSGIYYSQGVDLGRTAAQVAQNIAPHSLNEPFGTPADEWSYVLGMDYSLCDQHSGTTYGLTTQSAYEELPAMLLLEKPLVTGTPNITVLEEIDQIVSSIQGINQDTTLLSD